MKIALIGTFPQRPGDVMGGVAMVIQYLASGLAERGHEVHVVTTGNRVGSSNDWPSFTVHFVRSSEWLPATIANPFMTRRAVQALLQQLKPDVCHFHGTATFSIGCSWPNVLTLHGVSEFDVRYGGGVAARLKSLLQAAIEGYCRKRARNVIIINPYISDVLGRHIRGKTWTIENPVAANFFEMQSSPTGKTLMFAGMINRRKNVIGLLRAFERVLESDHVFELMIAGPVRDEAYYRECQAFLEQAGIENRVRFLGGCDSGRIAQLLAQSSCMVLVSYQETAPLIIGEAMARGVPVVASDVGGVKYMIENGVTGFVVEPDDSDSIALSILKVHNSETDRWQMGNTARDVALRRFHLDSILDKTLDVYREVIAQRGRK